MDFTLSEKYMTSVKDRREYDCLDNLDNPTPEDIVKILKGSHKIVTFGNKDHDEFTKLRNQLEELGYIKCERRWWNGDVVLKPFTLNGFKFKKDQRFPCASAMGIAFKVAKKHRRKTID
jgi:hypothetical protein